MEDGEKVIYSHNNFLQVVDVTAGLWVIGPVQGDTFDFGATDRNLVASIAVINILGLGHYMPERGIAVLGVGELVVLVFGAGKETGDLRDGAKGIDLFVPRHLFGITLGDLVFEN